MTKTTFYFKSHFILFGQMLCKQDYLILEDQQNDVIKKMDWLFGCFLNLS